MIVIDASVAVSALLNDGPARQTCERESLHAPHLIDSEVAHVLRRLDLTRRVDSDVATALIENWRSAGIVRYPVHPVLGRVWELRANLSAHDAGYVALAESLGCDLVTADARLGRAPGLRCPVTVLPG